MENTNSTFAIFVLNDDGVSGWGTMACAHENHPKDGMDNSSVFLSGDSRPDDSVVKFV